LNALAADAVLFERAYSASPQTLPSHASMLTGRYPFATGVRDQAGFTIKRSERLVQEILAARGYDTAAMVSSYLLRKETGIDQGFAKFDASRGDVDATAKAAERWLDGSGGGRAFLFLQADVAANADSYDARVLRADLLVARLVRYLKTHQLYDRSTLIVTSDHGEGLGDHGETGHGLFVYEEDLHVPLLLKLPAGDFAGRRIAEPVQLADLTPTILEFAKAPMPGNLHGAALQPLVAGSGGPGQRVIYSESLYGTYHFWWPPLMTMTDGRYRYIKGGGEALYDLKTDPACAIDIATKHRDVAAAMRRAIDKLAVTEPTVDSAVTSAERKELAAAGYIGFRSAGDDLTPGAVGSVSDDTWTSRAALVEQYRSAAFAAAARDWSTAIDGFRALAREQPQAAAVWMDLGAVARAAERHDLAADAFKRAVDLSPDSSEARLGAAWALFRLRKVDEARQAADDVIDAGTAGASAGEAHELLARIALLRKDADRAREEAALAEKNDPSRPVKAFVEGRLAYDAGRYASAADAFDAALAAASRAQRDPLTDLRYYAGDTLLRLDRFGEAEYLLTQELTESPNNARARASLAALYRATGRAADGSAVAH
jgi:tetratricopeptide (TPR) repeat protein